MPQILLKSAAHMSIEIVLTTVKVAFKYNKFRYNKSDFKSGVTSIGTQCRTESV